MHNLGTVFKFEMVRTLKKKSFWLMALSFPVTIAAIFVIVFFSNQATNEAAQSVGDQKFSFKVTDESNYIAPNILKSLKADKINDKDKGIAAVKSGSIDAYIYYPANIKQNKVEVYANDVGLFDNSRYQAMAEQMLTASAASKAGSDVTAILQGSVGFNSTTYKDGAEYNGFKQLIAPGIFLILFYILIIMFGNQMLTSTTEEKENRVIEMILTTIKPRALIIGKILSLLVLAMIQIVIILIPVVIAYLFLRDNIGLPELDLANIPLDPIRIAIGAVLFMLSFLLFTGVLVAIGAATPTAKEAGGFWGVVMVLIFGPLYAVTLFVSSPEAVLVKILSFFPLTAPIPLLLRNAIGNLTPGEAALGIAILAVSAVLALGIAIRMFRFGALEYSKRISLKSLFPSKKS